MKSAGAAANAVRRGLATATMHPPTDAPGPMALMEGMLGELGSLSPYAEGQDVPLAFIVEQKVLGGGSRWQRGWWSNGAGGG